MCVHNVIAFINKINCVSLPTYAICKMGPVCHRNRRARVRALKTRVVTHSLTTQKYLKLTEI